MGVFDADLPFVLGEARRRRTEDRQVDVDQQSRIGFLGLGLVTRGQHQRVHALRRVGTHACIAQCLLRPVGAAFLVVVAVHVVDGVVEPERQRDLGRALCMAALAREAFEAFVQVLQRVVGAMRLAVMCEERIEERVGRIHAERGPGVGPCGVARVGLQWMHRSRPAAQSLFHLNLVNLRS